MLLDKKALGTWKNKHALHVLLIMDQEGCTKAVAEAQAYHEGPTGMARRVEGPSAPKAPENPGAPKESAK